MRGSARRAIVVDVPSFGWDRAVVAVLRHSTLPWHEEFAREIHLDASPLASLDDLGARDRLSLAGQFAAHLAFLQFAGIGDAAFDVDEWVVIRKVAAQRVDDRRLAFAIGARDPVVARLNVGVFLAETLPVAKEDFRSELCRFDRRVDFLHGAAF